MTDLLVLAAALILLAVARWRPAVTSQAQVAAPGNPNRMDAPGRQHGPATGNTERSTT